ncbi:MAG: ParB/RepB/Spo0J family partition protein [Candidatus Eremiobacteraeota bacterium]|nr:ParB/RepB/Spo0J family partition protein [Candidatus Eremiobacteraeota bacterium]MBC5826341.1 ParB/RepB/Spo0J family partition protein [Candidatus Eremiobacteraeota bacterium]
MSKSRGLGRGLGAFFPDSAAAPPTPGGSETLVHLGLNDIAGNPHQPRRSFGEEELRELAESIRANGLLAPIVVRSTHGVPPYEIIAGERRWRAARAAGLESIAAIVRTADDGQAIELALLENVQRADLNPIEEAAGYAQLMQHHAFTQEQLANRLGKSRPAIANALRLLSLPDSVAALIRDGRLSSGHGRALAGLPAAQAEAIAARAATGRLSVRAVERAAARAEPPPSHAAGRGLPPDLADAENRLRFALATKVTLRGSASAGSIEIRYSAEEDLQRIIDRVCQREI